MEWKEFYEDENISEWAKGYASFMSLMGAATRILVVFALLKYLVG